VADRLAARPPLTGLDDIGAVLQAPENPMAPQSAFAAAPPGVLRRLQRCVNDSPEGLIRRGVVTSGEVLARLRKRSMIRVLAVAKSN
jgi:hypothetical protein